MSVPMLGQKMNLLGLTQQTRTKCRVYETHSLETRCCQGCGENILDKFLLLVNDRSWHGDCLRCCICRTSLDEQTSCFIRDNRIYCKGDYVSSDRCVNEHLMLSTMEGWSIVIQLKTTNLLSVSLQALNKTGKACALPKENLEEGVVEGATLSHDQIGRRHVD
uniref:LIM zinc-binding domain-containing protein n=1 Tax=Timema cristinae TaxID=61476 RepID=A0A7R9GTE8_TIMCR|nr:unnamed protein product [Timema cristinae]